ncbi:uncharacterized protein GJ701_005561 [Geothlypis trichas]
MPVRRCRGAVGEPAPSRNGSALGREGGNERAREEGAAAPRLGPTSCRAGRRGPAPASPAARRERRLLAAEPSRAEPSRPLAAGLGAGRARCAAPAPARVTEPRPPQPMRARLAPSNGRSSEPSCEKPLCLHLPI